MKVLKFGGSSVSNAGNCKRVQEIIKRDYANCKQVVVVSAFGGVTDELERCINLASQRNKEYEIALLKLRERHDQVTNELNVPDEIIVARLGSPIAIGIGENNEEFFVASDASPFIEYTKDAIYLDDEELAIIELGKEIRIRKIQDDSIVEPNIQELKLNLED